MVRPILTVLVAAALAAAALAETDTSGRQREYTSRLLKMEDTAAGHAELARWCEQVGLDEKAERHWREVLFRDADHEAAHAALGHVRRGEEWVEAATSPGVPAASDREPAEASREARRRALARTVQDAYVTYLNADDETTWQEGAQRMRMIRDAEAAEPVHRILSSGTERTRRLMCEVLGQLPGREAARRLVRVLLADTSRAVYDAAVEALAMRSDDHALAPLLNALDGSEEAVQRAAHALGELRERRAVPKLIARLTIRQVRTKKFKEKRSSGPHFFFGKVATYIADVDPVVAPGVVAFDPVIGGLPVGAGASTPAEDQYETVRREVVVLVRLPEVRKALVTITGQDFEFDEAAWRGWLRRHEAQQRAEPRALPEPDAGAPGDGHPPP